MSDNNAFMEYNYIKGFQSRIEKNRLKLCKVFKEGMLTDNQNGQNNIANLNVDKNVEDAIELQNSNFIFLIDKFTTSNTKDAQN